MQLPKISYLTYCAYCSSMLSCMLHFCTSKGFQIIEKPHTKKELNKQPTISHNLGKDYGPLCKYIKILVFRWLTFDDIWFCQSRKDSIFLFCHVPSSFKSLIYKSLFIYIVHCWSLAKEVTWPHNWEGVQDIIKTKTTLRKVRQTQIGQLNHGGSSYFRFV